MNGKLTVQLKGVIGDSTINIENARITPTSNHQNCCAYNIEFDLPKDCDQNEIASFVFFNAEDEKMYRLSGSPRINDKHVVAIGLH